MDNATAEYNFVTTFFKLSQTNEPMLAPRKDSLLSPDNVEFADRMSAAASERGGVARSRAGSIISPQADGAFSKNAKNEHTALVAIWKQIFDPVLQYTEVRISFS